MNEKETFVKSILEGTTKDSPIRLNHPLIKLGFTLLPLTIGSFILLFRLKNYHFPLQPLLLNALVILTCLQLDFRATKRLQCILWIGILVTAIIASSFNILSSVSIKTVLDFLGITSSILTYIRPYLSFEDIIIFAYFLIAVKGISLFVATDVLWLARFLFFRNFQIIFILIIFTFFMVKKSFTTTFSLAWSTARNKFRLFKLRNTLAKAFFLGAQLFFQKFLTGCSDTVKLTLSLLKERGFYQKVARNELTFKLSNEDYVAILIMVINTAYLTVIFRG